MNAKRLITLLLAVVMICSLSISAFAANVTINKAANDTATHTYEAYKIFNGDLAADGKTLSNITWGDGIDQTKLGALATALNGLKTGTEFKDLTASSSAADFADAISKLNAAADDPTAKAIAAALAAALSSNKTTGNNTGVSGLEVGYYLIKDADAALTGTGAKTRFILRILNATDNLTVNEKASIPSVEKKVKDINDSTETEYTDWQDSADHDIGDAVPFKLTATTASTVHDYAKYHVTFEDQQSAGLAAPAKFNVTVAGTALGELTNTVGEYVTGTVADVACKAEVVAADANQTFAIKVSFTAAEGKKLSTDLDSKPIVITYKSVLNANAVIGAPGNPNEVYLKYSNNPNSSDDNEEGQTPKDKVIVFTFKVDVNKKNEKNEDLTGANFTLYKEVPAGTEGAQTGAAIKTDLAAQNASIKAAALADAKSYIVVGNKTGDASGFTFEFKGIDDGNYVLVETTIPDGYNAWDAAAFKVSAAHDNPSDDPKLTELVGGDLFTGNAGTVNLQEGALNTNIVNKSGNTLPSTGGVGTTIFYVLGGILVIAAAVMLITKKRMDAQA